MAEPTAEPDDAAAGDEAAEDTATAAPIERPTYSVRTPAGGWPYPWPNVEELATGYTDASTVSLPTATVARGTLKTHPKPSVQGAAKVGRTLKVRPVKWETGVKLSYRWYAGSKAIAGATKAALKVKKSLAGKKLHVVVTATKSGYTTVTRFSSSTAKVKP
jgi:hypothetical protein